MEKELRKKLREWALGEDVPNQTAAVASALCEEAIGYLWKGRAPKGSGREELGRRFSDPWRLAASLELFEEDVFLLAGIACGKEIRPETDGEWDACGKLFCAGLLYPFRRGEDTAFLMPDEIREACGRALSPQLRQRRLRRHKLRRFAQAAVNLYGFIPQAEFVLLYNKLNDTHYDLETATQLLYPFAASGQAGFLLYREYIVNPFFDDAGQDGVSEMAALKRMIAIAWGKPRYVPRADELLRYQNPVYIQKNSELEKLASLVRGAAGTDAEGWETIAMLYDFCRTTPDALDQLSEFDWMPLPGGDAPEEKTRERFTSLMNRVYENTRQWANKGMTPKELKDLNWQPPRRKAGRNDPCPCGSGKKYKKCCMLKDQAAGSGR